MDEHKKPKLNELINNYQQTKAPPGFAQRVSANLPVTRPSLIGIPGVAVAASIAVVAVVSIVIVQSIEDVDPQLKPDTYIAKPEQPKQQQQTQLAKVEPQEKSARTESTVTEQQLPQAKTPQDENNRSLATVSISAEERQLFFSEQQEINDSSLAVLTDISDWLDAQPEISNPDISDLPTMNDIDLLFETS